MVRHYAAKAMDEVVDRFGRADADDWIAWSRDGRDPADGGEVVTVGPSVRQPIMVLAAGEHLNGRLAGAFRDAYHVADMVALTDGVAEAVKKAHPDVVVLSRYLPGDAPVAAAMAAARRAAPNARFVLIVGALDPPARQLISDAARYGIYNVLVGEQINIDALADLVRREGQWADIAAYLPEGITGAAPRTGDVPRPPAAPLRDPEIAAAQVVAVISGKGGVGKTSFVANCLVAAAPWGAVGIDADFIKPTLHLAFHAPDDVGRPSLDQLLTTWDLRRRDPAEAAGGFTDRDRADIRQWVHQAELVAQGVRLVSGPSRLSPLPAQVPPGLVAALAEASQNVARLTLIDTPGSANEDSWVEAVQAADWIVLVTTPDYPAVLESVDALRKLDYLHVARSRVWLVISQRGKTGYSTSEIVQTHLPLPLLAVIPEDRAKWHRAWRLHQPPALRERAFWSGVVRKIIGVDPDRPVRRNPFRWPRRRRDP